MAFGKKTDEEIVTALTQDTEQNKIHWSSNEQYIFSELKVGEGIEIIFRISDINKYEEEDEYYSRYQFYEMNDNELILSVSLKKNTLKQEIFIKRLNVSQMQLLFLLDHVMYKLGK